MGEPIYPLSVSYGSKPHSLCYLSMYRIYHADMPYLVVRSPSGLPLGVPGLLPGPPALHGC